MPPPHDAQQKNRHSIRLRGFDYRNAGAYFITICTHKMQLLLGQISDNEMLLNELGRIAHECWHVIPDHFPFVELDDFVVMPNHVHGILWIGEYDDDETPSRAQHNNGVPPSRAQHDNGVPPSRAQHVAPLHTNQTHNNMGIMDRTHNVGAQHAAPTTTRKTPTTPQTPNVLPKSLSAIVRSYKAAVTKRIRETLQQPDAKIWQRNYHEHIVRTDDDLNRIRHYIRDNPQRWWDKYGET